MSPPPEAKGGWLAWAVYGLTAVVFLPLTLWLYQQTVRHDQLLHALAVLAMAGGMLAYENRRKLRFLWSFSNTSINLLVAAFVLLGFSAVFRSQPAGSLLILPSYLLALASALIFAFGPRITRFLRALLGAFTLFVFMVLLLPVADWPLRALAGNSSAWFLDLLGFDVSLGLVKGGGDDPQLMLLSNGQPFHVAAECNGFGVLTASLLLTLLLVIYKRLVLFDKVLLLLTALTVGYLFNTLRIVIIVQLAPIVGFDSYHLMHEIVGGVTYYGCLGLLWWLIDGFQRARTERHEPLATEAHPTPA